MCVLVNFVSSMCTCCFSRFDCVVHPAFRHDARGTSSGQLSKPMHSYAHVRVLFRCFFGSIPRMSLVFVIFEDCGNVSTFIPVIIGQIYGTVVALQREIAHTHTYIDILFTIPIYFLNTFRTLGCVFICSISAFTFLRLV